METHTRYFEDSILNLVCIVQDIVEKVVDVVIVEPVGERGHDEIVDIVGAGVVIAALAGRGENKIRTGVMATSGRHATATPATALSLLDRVAVFHLTWHGE